MKKESFFDLFAALFACACAETDTAMTRLATRLTTEFLPPRDREGLLSLGFAICRLRETGVPPHELALFAEAVRSFLAEKCATDAPEQLLALRRIPGLRDAAELLLCLWMREL